jgi:hypothetical protein
MSLDSAQPRKVVIFTVEAVGTIAREISEDELAELARQICAPVDDELRGNLNGLTVTATWTIGVGDSQ